MLPGGEEGNAGEEMGIPQRNLPLRDLRADEALPLIILQHHVAEQVIMRDSRGAHDLAVSRKRQMLKEVLSRQQGAVAEGLLMEHHQGREQQDYDKTEVGRSSAAQWHQHR